MATKGQRWSDKLAVWDQQAEITKKKTEKKKRTRNKLAGKVNTELGTGPKQTLHFTTMLEEG